MSEAPSMQPFTPELRKDIITREWVIISRGRGRRPTDLAVGVPEGAPTTETCPFCPGNEGASETLLTLPDGPTGWKVRVVRNKFPALIWKAEVTRKESGIYDSVSGNGSHEVVIESPDHNLDIWQMSQGQVEAVLDAYRQRFIILEQDPLVRYVLIFRNHGLGAGTSLAHPHSQIIATPVVPHYIEAEVDGIKRYWEYIERCPFCAIITQELATEERLISQNEGYVAVTAFAGRFPYESWIIPRRHQPHFRDTTDAERASLAAILRDTLGRIAGALNFPSYNYALHTGPAGAGVDSTFHWHLEIFPRVTTPGGFELGSDLYINTTTPEDAARALRESSIPAG